MTFHHPFILSMLILPVALIVWQWKSSGQRVILPFDHANARPGRFLRMMLNLALSLPPLILAVAIVVAAGPQRLAEPKSKRVLTNIEFCLDVSGSMTARFGGGTRYDAAMDAINGFIGVRQGDSFGLTIFSDSVLQWVPLTSDPSAFRCARPFLNPMTLPPWFGGGTKIGLGLESCLKVLASREEGDRMIILVSDGYSWDLSGGNDEVVARKLKENRVVVYTVHVAEGEPPAEVATIATVTGGQVFAAGDPDTLHAVFKRIDEMKVTRLEKSSPEVQDSFDLLCWAGLGALALFHLTLFVLRATPW